jgi:cyclic pyranopterin phosphate synthase
MVDVGDKPETDRTATASGSIQMGAATLRAVRSGAIAKGDVLAVAQTAAIMAAKRTWELIPMCHPLMLSGVHADFRDDGATTLTLSVTVRNRGRTGVEMEALTAVSVGLLTVYDMCKAIDRGMTIGDVRLDVKEGGQSGTWRRDAAP